MKNILLAGAGGQGTVLASKLIAQCAIDNGQNARTAETIGMAQRGGCVVSHVRVGDEIHSPLIPIGQADIIVGFEPAEAVRNFKYLKKDGTVIVNSDPIKPITDSLAETGYDGGIMLDFLKSHAKKVIIIDGADACAKCGSPKSLNIVLLGAAIGSGVLGFTEETVIKAIKNRFPVRLHDVNIKAFETGIELAGKE